MTLNDSLQELKVICKEHEVEMNKISQTIKDVEKSLRDCLPFLHSKLLIDDFELIWNGTLERIIFNNKEMIRPLIECPFNIRKMIVEEQHLHKLINAIKDGLLEQKKESN